MPEIINTYILDDPETVIPMNRQEFYLEQMEVFRTMGHPTRAAEIIDIFIFNEHGEVFIQKRADHKAHNPGLFDKAVGGHVQHGDLIDYTVMVESVQELQVPSIVMRSDTDFSKALGLLKPYLGTVSLIRKIDSRICVLEKIIAGDAIKIANKVHLFFGIYGGAVKTVDNESRGVLLYALENLESEIAKFPKMFTDDLAFFMTNYRKELYAFRDSIAKR